MVYWCLGLGPCYTAALLYCCTAQGPGMYDVDYLHKVVSQAFGLCLYSRLHCHTHCHCIAQFCTAPLLWAPSPPVKSGT